MGSAMNLSGVEDDVLSALAEHDDCQDGDDY